MHLIDTLKLRPHAAEAVFLSLTQRCPLSCRHCSTNSMMTSQEHGAAMFRRFVASFAPDDHPQLMYLTGGEALLRPRLVADLAVSARSVGTKTLLLSGMFFARSGIHGPIRDAINAVDHLSASIDVFHEEEVPRAKVLKVLEQLHREGKAVSVQVTGVDDDDPYLADVTKDIRSCFSDEVPILVSHVGAIGRAADWLPARETRHRDPGAPLPCVMAGWPVVTYDGTVMACCNEQAVAGAGPEHLRLAHIREHDWVEVRLRCRASPLMRAIRVLGPQELSRRAGSGGSSGYCDTCFLFSDNPSVVQEATRVCSGEGFDVLEGLVADMQSRAVDSLLRRYGSPRYAELAWLGYEGGNSIA